MEYPFGLATPDRRTEFAAERSPESQRKRKALEQVMERNEQRIKDIKRQKLDMEMEELVEQQAKLIAMCNEL